MRARGGMFPPFSQISACIFLTGPYILVWRWKDLAAAAGYVHKFDRIAGEVGNWPCQTKRRILTGLVLTYALVSSRPKAKEMNSLSNTTSWPF